MPKTQVNLRMSTATKTKLDHLTTLYGTQAEAIAVALDRLYQSEKETQMNPEKITTVRHGFHAADLFAGWDDDEKYNIPASAAKYAELVEAELKKQYPGAEIETPYDLDASGVLPAPLQTAINDDPNHDNVLIVEHIAAQVYKLFNWTIEN